MLSEEPMVDWNDIAREMEKLCPSSLATRLDRTRPYEGQPHTDEGERGKQEISGITMRDLSDCFIRACYDASGLEVKDWPGTVYDLPWPEMDIIAVMQNLTCNVEKYMGIYPNVPRLFPKDPTQNHWCGANLDNAEWTSHEGKCP